MASYIRILKELVYKWERAAPSPFRGPRPTVPLNSTGTPSKSLTHFHTLGIGYIQDLYIITQPNRQFFVYEHLERART